MKNELPKEILPHLLEIANRLWTGHATIMIGAGFSKNAKGGESTTKHFPTWNELGDSFYKKIHGVSPLPKDQCYLNALKLADEVQAAFGRNTLDQILKTEIPDKEYQPSTLHERTLQLPWTDVFTTNYDTLLERAAEKILQQRYETVVNKEDLILSTKPRIIKLHGSFPSERPFIITEEDYRKYPQEFAPFVNTVQQSLLENTLCLVGFSGDDPNFLKWIGWIRDNLGKENSPKIYLIGILSLSIGARRLLEERNIVPLDMSACDGVNSNHENALTVFVDYLHKQGKIEESLNWPNNTDSFHFKTDKDVNEQIKPILRDWKKIRLKYPNWLIVPKGRRDSLQTTTEYSSAFLYHLQKIESTLDIEFLYEYNWILEKCLTPIQNDWIEHYEKVVDKYNPFPESIQIENAIDKGNENIKIDWNSLSKFWIELQISMLRFYREEEFTEKWIKLAERIDRIISYLSSELVARYHYERCLYSLFALDINSVRTEIDLWKTDVSLPYWEAKRAGLLAELGEVNDAEKILELSLISVRNKLNLSPVVNDYSAVSQEAYILQLLRYVKNSTNHIKGVYQFDKSKDYTDRWNKLIQYKCDPWGELKSFELYLQKESPDLKVTEQKYTFEIGKITTTHHWGRSDKYAEKAYSFLRYIEETGIPLKLPGGTFGKDVAQKAISYIANFSSSWALVSFIRNGDTEAVDSLFGRKQLSMMDQKSVDHLAIKYLSVLENSISEITKGDTYRNNNFAISLSTVIPEILSRLSVKCSYEVKLKLLYFLKGAFLSEFRGRYNGIMHLTKWLIGSLSVAEQYNLINEFLDFPLLKNLHFSLENEYIDPFQFIYIPNYQATKFNKIAVESSKIDILLADVLESEKVRSNAIKRLSLLLECGLLSDSQVELFGQNLWSKIDKNNGFPLETDYSSYYYFIFTTLPHPMEVDPIHLLKEYFAATAIEIHANKKERELPITNGRSRLLYNIIGTANSNVDYKWNEKELNKLVNDLVEWWNGDKKYLLEKDDDSFFGSVSKEFIARFKNMIKVFSEIIFPNIKLINKTEVAAIGQVLGELEEYGMPALEAKTSFFKVFPKKQKGIIDEVYQIIFSKTEAKIIDVINAVIILAEQNYKGIYELVKYISENVRCRTEVELYRYIECMSIIIKKHSQIIDEKIVSDLEVGLSYLANETIINYDDTDEMVHNKLLIKKNAAYLSVQIFQYAVDNNISVPNSVLQWKDLCLDPNEFSEIRNIWLNSGIE